jgi:hypothetical protein
LPVLCVGPMNASAADDANSASPKATATRPAQDRPGQTSLPSDNAPPMTSTQTTGSNDQSPVVKEMNAEELEKVKREGK